jgi:protein-L-isoaspartate(D-aspartate) O-methyltransferase
MATLTEWPRVRKLLNQGADVAMDEQELTVARERLLEEIAAEVRHTANWTGRAALSPRVMAAMARVPRHEFVPPPDHALAYINRPLSIGHGQTISQPYIVAIMTDLLDINESDRVLEIGCGSGYQAAVLAEIAKDVYSVEVVPTLAEEARLRLARLNYANVHIRIGDGYAGWPDQAPFDAIIVTSAPLSIPDALVDQLKAGGRLVVPVGRAGETQTLYRCERTADGRLVRSSKLPVAFVPMVPGNTEVDKG